MYVRVFLLAGFVASLSGCLDSGKRVEAILRVNRELSDGNSADFMIYKETQANLVKSNYVINAALRDPDLANIKGLTPSSPQALNSSLRTRQQRVDHGEHGMWE